jgi:hypothetical protein
MKLDSYRVIVLETNVLMTASEHASQASDECVRQCVGIIEQVKQGTPTLALDNSGLILAEYQKRLRAYPNSIGYMLLMPKVANPRQHHRDAEFVRGGDDLGVFFRAAGLYNLADARPRRQFDTVGEWKEGV